MLVFIMVGAVGAPACRPHTPEDTTATRLTQTVQLSPSLDIGKNATVTSDTFSSPNLWRDVAQDPEAANDGMNVRNHWAKFAGASYTAGFQGAPAGAVSAIAVTYRAAVDQAGTLQVLVYDGTTLLETGPARALSSAFATYTDTYASVSASGANNLRVQVRLTLPSAQYAYVSAIRLSVTIGQPDPVDAGAADLTSGGPAPAPGPGPVTLLHYSAGAGLDASGAFPAGAYGFDLADVSSVDEVNALPPGVQALVWIGTCAGADATFTAAMQPFVGNPRVFGFYLMDEPDPTGIWKPACPAANLKAESDWVHAHMPSAKTFIILNVYGSSWSPTYVDTYNPANSGIDLYGLDPYPCRVHLAGCDDSIIALAVQAASVAGIPLNAQVPVYQAFGGGGWVSDTGDAYLLPTVDQEQQIFAAWAQVLPSPVFDYAYSWGPQNGDTALANGPEALRQAFLAHNSGAPSSSPPDAGVMSAPDLAMTPPPDLAMTPPPDLATPPPAGADPILVGSGDIAVSGGAQDVTAQLMLDLFAAGATGGVFTAGDNVYNSGSASEFASSFDPSWGKLKARLRPTPGNHDYADGADPAASGYFGYFGGAAGDPQRGYYSYDLGAWHVIVLNTSVGCTYVGGCAAGSPQEQWLRADLKAHPNACTVAMWHEPRFSSGSVHGSDPETQDLWQALYDYNADVILEGHDHEYERFAPQTATGVADAARGLRSFVVGSGGGGLYTFGPAIANSEVRYSGGYGVLALTLHATSYDWRFIAEPGQPFSDSGTGKCH
jgi:hypothetical protein